MSRALVAGAGLASLAGVMALGSAGCDIIGGGYSNADRESDKQRARAKAERAKWDAPEGESRQVRRARERREAKR